MTKRWKKVEANKKKLRINFNPLVRSGEQEKVYLEAQDYHLEIPKGMAFETETVYTLSYKIPGSFDKSVAAHPSDNLRVVNSGCFATKTTYGVSYQNPECVRRRGKRRHCGCFQC